MRSVHYYNNAKSSQLHPARCVSDDYEDRFGGFDRQYLNHMVSSHLKSSRSSVTSEDYTSFPSSLEGSREPSRHGEFLFPEEHMHFSAYKSAWECGICHKGFKARLDLEQHLQSMVHGAVKFACAECKKGFATMAAVVRHIEQTKHVGGFQSVQSFDDSAGVGLNYSSSHGWTESTGPEPLPISSNPTVCLIGSHETVIQRQRLLGLGSDLENTLFYLSASILQEISPANSSCYIRISYQKEDEDITVAETSYEVSQSQPQSLLAEYEALHQGVALAIRLGARRLELRVSHPLLHLHLASSRESALFPSMHPSVQTEYLTVRQLLEKMQQFGIRLMHHEEQCMENQRAKETLHAHLDVLYPDQFES